MPPRVSAGPMRKGRAQTGRAAIAASCGEAGLRVCLPSPSLTFPDTPINVAVAVVRVVLKTATAIERNIAGVDQVNRRHKTADRLACKQAIQFIHELPALHGERFSHGSRLISVRLNPQEGR